MLVACQVSAEHHCAFCLTTTASARWRRWSGSRLIPARPTRRVAARSGRFREDHPPPRQGGQCPPGDRCRCLVQGLVPSLDDADFRGGHGLPSVISVEPSVLLFGCQATEPSVFQRHSISAPVNALMVRPLLLGSRLGAQRRPSPGRSSSPGSQGPQRCLPGPS